MALLALLGGFLLWEVTSEGGGITKGNRTKLRKFLSKEKKNPVHSRRVKTKIMKVLSLIILQALLYELGLSSTP